MSKLSDLFVLVIYFHLFPYSNRGVLKTTPLGSDLDDLDMVEVDHGVDPYI